MKDVADVARSLLQVASMVFFAYLVGRYQPCTTVGLMPLLKLSLTLLLLPLVLDSATETTALPETTHLLASTC